MPFVGGFVRPFGNGLEAEVEILEAQMRGTIQARLDKNFIGGPNANGLLRQDLKELVLETEGEIIEQGSFRSHG